MAKPWMRHIVVLLACMLSISGYAKEKAAQEKYADVRVLIDVSGSMRQNDPNNLRIPATKLLLNLLPKNSRAAVWLFGTRVTKVLPVDKVTEKWLSRANKSVNKIHSRGQYTRIDQALEKIIHNWRNDDPKAQKTVIMLTDGFVDVSRDKTKNLKAREFILKGLLPTLNRKNIKVYTIALSKKSDVDLSRKLALGTDGFYKQIDSAEDLERTFVKIFEAAVERDNLPIKEGGFAVDKKTREFTIMVFSKPGAKPLVLRTPSGKLVSEKKLAKNMKWHHEKRYDLVTVRGPETGKWSIVGNKDEDNRVYIVSDLKLQATALPKNIFLFEKFNYQARLLEKNKIITHPKFLSSMKIDLLSKHDEAETHWSVLDDGKSYDRKAGDGIFTRHIEYTKHNLGLQEITLSAHNQTVERSLRQVVNVHASPVQVSVDPDQDDSVMVNIMAQEDLVRPAGLFIDAMITDADGGYHQQQVKPSGNGLWQLPMDTSDGQAYAVTLSIKGETVNGRPFAVTLPAVMVRNELSLAPEAPAPAPKPALEPKPAPEPEPVVEEQEEEEAPEALAEDEEDEFSSDDEPEFDDEEPKDELPPPSKDGETDYTKLAVAIVFTILYLAIIGLLFKFILQYLRKKKMESMQDDE